MQDKSINVGGASSTGGEDVRPSRDVQSLLIPESPGFSRREYVNKRHFELVLNDETPTGAIYTTLRNAGFEVAQVEETTYQIAQRINGLFVKNWLKVHGDMDVPYMVAKKIADEFPVVSGRRSMAYMDGFMNEYLSWMKMRAQQLQGQEVSVE